MAEMVDLRCPITPIKLFAKVKAADEDVLVLPDNVIEVACASCRKTLREQGRDVTYVLHRYNLLGECIETEVV